MEHSDSKKHIKIDSILLFQLNPMLNCTYALWIYLYLRLKYNLTQQEYDLSWRVDVKEIADFFKIHKATVFEALKLLQHIGLMMRQERGFYSIDGEAEAVSVIRKCCESEGRILPVNSHLPIYNDFFVDFFNRGGMPMELEIYYYLVKQNQHFTMDQDFLEVCVNQKQVCDIFFIDHRTYKKCVENLIRHGLLAEDETGRLLTKSPNSDLTAERISVSTDTTMENVIQNHTTINEQMVPERLQEVI